MRLSTNLRREIRAFAIFLCGAWVVVPMVYFACEHGYFDNAPTWVPICFGIFITLLTYAWWRQGLSADKTEFKKPPIW